MADLDLGRCPSLPERFQILLPKSDPPKDEQKRNRQGKGELTKAPSVFGSLTTEGLLSPSKTQRSMPLTPGKTEASVHSTPMPFERRVIDPSTPIGTRGFRGEPVEASSPQLPAIDADSPSKPWPRPPKSPEAIGHSVGTGDRLTIANLLRHRDIYGVPQRREPTPELVSPEPTPDLVKLLDPALISYKGSIEERSVQLLGLEKDGKSPNAESAIQLDKYVKRLRLEWTRLDSK